MANCGEGERELLQTIYICFLAGLSLSSSRLTHWRQTKLYSKAKELVCGGSDSPIGCVLVGKESTEQRKEGATAAHNQFGIFLLLTQGAANSRPDYTAPSCPNSRDLGTAE